MHDGNYKNRLSKEIVSRKKFFSAPILYLMQKGIPQIIVGSVYVLRTMVVVV